MIRKGPMRLALVLAVLALPALAGEREPVVPPVTPEGEAAQPEAEAEAKPEEPAPVAEPEAATPAEPEAPVTTPDETTLESYRSPFEVLSERMIGVTSRAVLFDWRKRTIGFGVTGGAVLELNNYYTARVGGFVRIPVGNLIAELAVTRVITSSSESAEKLALTPYRQAGRPNRVEFDINLGYALLEGVGTPRISLFPTVELVFTFNVGFRYLYYPNALGTANAGQVIEALFAPRLQDRELEYLERERLPGMQLDSGRYNLLAGFELDLYFRTGIFLSPRVMLNLPVFSGLAGSSLGWWWELNLSLGWML